MNIYARLFFLWESFDGERLMYKFYFLFKGEISMRCKKLKTALILSLAITSFGAFGAKKKGVLCCRLYPQSGSQKSDSALKPGC